VEQFCGRTRSLQLRAFVHDVVATTTSSGIVAMSQAAGEALADLRAFNYERVYLRPASVEQSGRVIDMLRALVDHYVWHPSEMPAEYCATGVLAGLTEPAKLAVGYVAGMTDRFACVQAVARLGWPADRLPRGFDAA
jgi:dGTPase